MTENDLKLIGFMFHPNDGPKIIDLGGCNSDRIEAHTNEIYTKIEYQKMNNLYGFLFWIDKKNKRIFKKSKIYGRLDMLGKYINTNIQYWKFNEGDTLNYHGKL